MAFEYFSVYDVQVMIVEKFFKMNFREKNYVKKIHRKAKAVISNAGYMITCLI